MMLTEGAATAQAALPMQAFRDHLRLGTGFADDGAQDAQIEAALRAAIAAIEARIGKALIAREFSVTLPDWRDPEAQALPVAPVQAVVSVTFIDIAGVETDVPAAHWRLVRDLQRPLLAASGALLPMVPTKGAVRIVFEAGFGSWDAVPVDLQQAVCLLGGQYFENRAEVMSGAPMPFGVMALVERWRTVRLLAGGGR